MKEVHVKTDIVINRPIAAVSAFAADPARATQWYKNILEVEWLTDESLEVGSKMAFKAKFLGRELSYIYEVKEWIPGSLMVMATADGPFPMETTYRWEALTPDTTRMTLINRGRPSGFARFISSFMSMAMRKANRKDLRLLKQILERKDSDIL